jgi:hypothetical protein
MSISTYTLYSDAAVETALDAVGGEMMGTQDTELLKQIFVAAGNATGGSMSSGIITPNVAYVRTNGDDATGVIGNPAKPYLTAQAAFDAGGRNFQLGVGVDDTINYDVTGADDATVVMYVAGQGPGASGSRLSVSVTAEDGNVSLTLYSNQSCQLNSASGSTANGASCYVELLSVICGTYNSQAPNGTATGIVKFCEIGTDSSGLLAASARLSRVNGVSYL